MRFPALMSTALANLPAILPATLPAILSVPAAASTSASPAAVAAAPILPEPVPRDGCWHPVLKKKYELDAYRVPCRGA
ncbi:hypothetical protein FE391_43865 [Nonomuraea sp. KC401]|uniref:hypothetical protein n=1 Tax=unclassified Nonomuraea TaxID=2593643 RepID=UPI0010FD6A74|nr:MULTISPECIES: hypothetical protein [unclassified Nonomuraea]NBF00271.1 hypothetical protein [Nonomuraea sp. K271]TLF52029.1 hypothetical protein FE391_43865 [Nonomuraea sp. KC401]